MSIFFDRFSILCNESGETPNSLAKKLNIPSGSITAWKKGTIPRTKTLDLLANYFHVSVDYLIGNVNEPYFYLDNSRIKQELNSYGDEDEMGSVLKDGIQIKNPDIRMIARAGNKMTPEQAENVRKYAQYMYPEAFEDDTP